MVPYLLAEGAEEVEEVERKEFAVERQGRIEDC